jgi:hypothetical protein
MDVQAAAGSASATATLPTVSFAGAASSAPPPPDAQTTGPAPVAAATLPPPPSSDGGSTPGSTPAPATAIGTFPAPATPGSAKTLSSDVSKLLDPSGSGTQVSFRVAGGSDQTVVVVTDNTGKVISQFPSETLIALAQFFDKLDGSVVDKKA